MDDSEIFVERDEIIADSEDELEELGSSNAAGRGSAISMPPPRQRQELSSIADFSSAKGGQDSSISSGLPTVFGTTLDERSFGRDADTSGYSNVFTGTLSIADRAKTRKRKSTDVLELTSDEDDELSLKPTTSKSKAKSPQRSSDIHVDQLYSKNSNPQHSSDSSSSKPRPRPRPVAKKSRMENPAYLEATKDLHTPSMPHKGHELPIETSPSRGHPHSDLPPSSMSTGLPRIETMGEIDDLFDGPLSSPGSLFSEEESKTKRNKKKQKRRSYPSDVEMEVDQLASPPPHIPSFNPYEEPVTGPPPPTFFAGSSQPEEAVSCSLVGQASKASTSGNVAPTPDPDVIDLTDIPATLAPAITVKKQAKPKKPRKKTSEEDFGAWEENGPAGLYVFDDDNDEDFNPSGDGVGKKKAKSKGKGKEKEKPARVTKVKGKGKQRNLDTTSDDIPVQIPANLNPEQENDLPIAQPPNGIPEVVITTKPARKSRTTKNKNKGTSDATGTSSINKEVFKSREFIDDSGDDASGPGPLTTNIEGQGPSEPKAFETPEVPISIDMAASDGRGSRGKTQQSNIMQSEDEDEFVLRPSTTKKGKKKAVVDVDDNTEEWEKLGNGGINQSDEVIRPSKPTNKGQEAKKKGKVSKKKRLDAAAKADMVDNDETAISDIRISPTLEQTSEELPAEDEPEEIVATKPRKTGSRKVVDDDDGDTLEQDEHVNEQRSGINSASKENRAPNHATNLVTPNVRANIAASSSKPVPGALYARYEITPRTRGPSMSELIRRANSHPSSSSSTHATPSDANKSSASGKLKSRPSLTPVSRVYSPYLKSSRSMLNKIAPLHPNRRTPPPPPPPIPPKKKTKKELEREERWEEELVESIGGLEAWATLGDDERKDMRRAKFAMEMGGWDD